MNEIISPKKIWIASSGRAITVLLVAGVMGSGCNNAGQGAISGSAVGALSGLAIGSLSGDAGKGAAIGAIAGGVGGAVIGDQNRRQSERADLDREYSQAPPAAASSVTYEAGSALSSLLGSWRMEGWLLTEAGERVSVDGIVTGSAQDRFFTKLDMRVTDPRVDGDIEGTVVLSQEGGRSVSMTSAFSSFPQMHRYAGELDRSGSIIELEQTHPETDQLVQIRLSDQRWTADVFDGSTRIESYTFTRD